MENMWMTEPAIWTWWLEKTSCVDSSDEEERDVQIARIKRVTDKDGERIHEKELNAPDPAMQSV